MDFPPLDDARWDRLLGAVIDQRPTVGDPAAPLSTPFPAPAARPAEQDRDDEDVEDVEDVDEVSRWTRTVHLDRV